MYTRDFLLMEWRDSSQSSYSSESVEVNGYQVTVCLDDEGPIRPAFYWIIEREGKMIADGWSPSVSDARSSSLSHVSGLGDPA